MTTREVVLDGGSPWGFRLHGGADTNQPLRISRVNPGSKAALRGIREGDFITSINGKSTKDISNAEAHTLLKNSGDTLKLGLNEDYSGSPKRRQYKTVHQETHSETVKRSSTTSYTLTSSKTVIQTEANNDQKTSNLNGNTTNVNGNSNGQSKNPIASQGSTLSSTSSSTASTYTTEGGGRRTMPDTKTKRKRSRNNRKRNKNSASSASARAVQAIETIADNHEEEKPEKGEDGYRVDSPELAKQKKTTTKMPAKSKSLDDDEMVKIQELSEVSESEDKAECKAIVSEAESEDWEEVKDLEGVEVKEETGTSSLSLTLSDDCVVSEISLISPEEELTLRNFLEGLNLINSPEDAVKQVHETSTIESIKARKAKKRQAIEQYFFPICQNPRYLDVISEETSDLSDREQPSLTQHLKQGTPELEVPEKVPPLPPRRTRRNKPKFNPPVENPTILVGAKIIETAPVTHGNVVESSLEAEVVYLEGSSGSTSPDPQSDAEEENTTQNGSAEILSSANSSAPELREEENSAEKRDESEETAHFETEESEIVEETQNFQIIVKKNNTITSRINIISNDKCQESSAMKEQTQETIPADLSFQLTPPPTPENISPKSESLGNLAEETSTLAFNTSVSTYLSEDNSSAVREIIEDPRYATLSKEIKEVIATYLKTKDEVESILSVPEKTIYSNVVSPPAPSPSPSLSSGSGSGSSRATSLCTIKHNPLNSSIADITSISKDEELLKCKEAAPSLREICVNFLMTQPFGVDVLQELAEVSLSLENLTNSLPGKVLSTPSSSQMQAFETSLCENDINSGSVELAVDKSEMNWVGLPTRDPNLLVCLSPTQKAELEKTRQIADEAEKLLDMHAKYISRSSYQSDESKQIEENVQITSITEAASSDGNKVSNRLLAIIRDEPGSGGQTSEDLSASMDRARLNAQDLTEWLQLARIRSVSNLAACDATANNRGCARIASRRRTSLPQEFYEEQMLYLLEKEREVQRELEHLEDEKRKLQSEMAPSRKFHPDDYHISRRGDFAESKQKTRPVSMPATSTSEFFRQRMYDEYMDKVAAREERKQLKVIKVTCGGGVEGRSGGVPPAGIENEFMDKVKEKQKVGKLQKNDSETDGLPGCDLGDDEPVLVMDGESLKGANILPKHLQEFVDITKSAAGAENSSVDVPENSSSDGVWSPGQKADFKFPDQPQKEIDSTGAKNDETVSPVWTPKSATSSPVVERKEFRPVKFESPVLGRKNYSEGRGASEENISKEPPPWKLPEAGSDTGAGLSSTLQKRLPTSHSSPASGFNEFSSATARLPRVQNPTITLLQKAREGQLPKGALYIEQEQKRSQNDRPPLIGPGEVLYKIKNEYTSESDSEKPRRMADLGPRKFEGIGPTTKDGMPVILRSEVKDANQSKWYKRMYDTIHKQKPHRDEYVTVRYKQRRAQHPYTSGYLSEPEPGAYDSDFTDYKYATLDRRRMPSVNKENDYLSSTMPRTTATESKKPDEVVRHGHEAYKNQPGRIENYVTGHSSISDKEAKEWWDEVMDIFDGHLEQQKRVPQPPQSRSFINQALKESGYESDSTLVFRRRDDTAQQLSPLEQKEVYKVIQKGGDIPLHGLRKPAPERPKESPRKYVENEVTIHYKTPVRHEIKEHLSEDELAYRQAEAMKKIYQEERRRKYLQELQDMNSRRHTDNFIPSQKSPIPLNRYDDFDDLSPSLTAKRPIPPRSPETRLLAKALYNFVGQTSRELTFRKGDLIYVRRQVDKNWYEGELNAMVGLFPVNYVEIVTHDSATKPTPRKSHEGQARAKYNFVAQTHLELSLAKGELVIITRRVDDNWFEGKIGGRKGIFPVSYVEILIDPSDPTQSSTKPVASPASHSLLLNGSSGGKESMGSHSYMPNLSSNQLTTSYHAKPVQVINTGSSSYGSLNRNSKNSVNQALHIETQSEPIPYRAMYKYLPQNDDELELLEGDTVFVLEKCDDGWYVGSSDRTGAFGTFPGNYVEKI